MKIIIVFLLIFIIHLYVLHNRKHYCRRKCSHTDSVDRRMNDLERRVSRLDFDKKI